MKTKNFTTEELENYLEQGKNMFFKYNRVYQLMYSENAGFYFMEIESKRQQKGQVPYTRRGRYVAFTEEQYNNHFATL